MVLPLVDNVSECKFVNCATVMATGDKQQPLSAKKLALRDLPNETRNIIPKSPGNSPLPKDKTPVADNAKVSSTQKQQASFAASPSRLQPFGGIGTNGHLVYVRRKLETESGKINSNNTNSKKIAAESVKLNNNSCDSPALKKCKNDCMSEPKQQPELAAEASASPLPVPANVSAAYLSTSSVGSPPAHSNGKSINGQPGPASNCLRAPIGSPVHPEPQKLPAAIPIQPETQATPARTSFQSDCQRPRDQHWKERFGQLQMFLKACDQSKQEEYIQSKFTGAKFTIACANDFSIWKLICTDILELISSLF